MSGKKIPLRQCIGCREKKEKKDLIRIVKNENHEICVDRTGKMNGRGAYICDNCDCLSIAFRTKGLNRAFKIDVSKEVYDELERQLSE